MDVRKPRPKVVEQRPQGHIAVRWHRQDSHHSPMMSPVFSFLSFLPGLCFQSRLQKVDPLALQEGDGREVGGEKPRLPWSSPDRGPPSSVLVLGDGKGPGCTLPKWLLASNPLGFRQLNGVFQGQTRNRESSLHKCICFS